MLRSALTLTVTKPASNGQLSSLLAVGRFDDVAEVVSVKKPGGKVRAADLRGQVVYRLPLLGMRL